jgi:polyisoprenoid-binding protein YceI
MVDPSHTRILFNVTHMGYSTMPGIFRDFEVQLDFDPTAPENSRLNVTVSAASVDMFDEELNKHLRAADFFDVAHHPSVRFESTGITMLDATRARVSGSLSMLGKTLPVTLAVTMNKLAPNPMNQRPRVGFAATAMIDRTAFGMTYGAPIVGSEIPLTISLEAEQAE